MPNRFSFTIPVTLHYFAFLILGLLLLTPAYSQDTATVNFYNNVGGYDISSVLLADSIIAEDREGGKEKVKRAEIIGFIGDDYQRFYIRFISVIQNPSNPHQYFAYGNTRVKEAICSFHGLITIREARIFKVGDFPMYKQGIAHCEVTLFEDQKQSSAGSIKGQLTTKFLIDNKSEVRYDALMFIADGFANNQFVGSWTSYRSGRSKRCHWGDYRIPNSGDLDIGAGEFSVSEKYVKNGWLNYMLQHMSPNLNIRNNTKKVEDENWWNNK